MSVGLSVIEPAINDRNVQCDLNTHDDRGMLKFDEAESVGWQDGSEFKRSHYTQRAWE